jgi:Protein of unknown function (DUF1552)
MNRISRRRFAAGLGAGLLAAPFVGKLGALRADGSTVAKNLVIFHSPNGTVHRHWRPQGSGSSFSIPAGTILEPLAGHKSDLVICDGIDFHGVDNHVPGMSAMLTGGGGAGTPTGGKSLDQYVAEQIGGTTRYRSLEFGVYTTVWGSDAQTRMSYSGAGTRVEPNDDPLDQYNRLFGELTAPQGEVDKSRLRRESVNKLVQGEITDLRGRVGSVEQAKLDEHMNGLKGLLQGGAVVANCGALPPAPTGLNSRSEDDVPAIGKAQMDMLVFSLACGLTRVASVQFSHTTSPMHMRWLGQSDIDHHGLSHIGDGDTVGIAKFIAAERWFSEQFGYLLEQLKATPDPEGGTLLDSTLVVWAKELGDPRLHDCKSVPWILAGGGGVIETGRYLNFQGAPHNKLLVSICKAMGLSNTTFGDPSKGTGTLTELIG